MDWSPDFHLQDRIKRRSIISPENGCWEWSGAKTVGYGRITIGSRSDGTRRESYAAHRASYEAFIGIVPDGYDVCHQCDNRGCVNPEHLFVGTRKDNMQDCINKNRFVYIEPQRGELHPQAKLSAQDVKEIRSTNYSSNKLGSLYGVSGRQIRSIRAYEYFQEPPK